MTDTTLKTINKYLKMRGTVDKVCDKLHRTHDMHTACKQGCDECCMNFRLLPIEFYSILHSIKELKTSKNFNTEPDNCLFLINHSCLIYQNRPIICRSHGLPILDMDQEGENWELSFCPLNFKTTDDEYFTHDNCYQQDSFNSKLYMLNLEFIKTFEEAKYERDEMIEISKFREYL